MPGFDRRQRTRNSSRRNGRRNYSGSRNGSQVINLSTPNNSFNRGVRRSNGNATKLYEKYSKLASDALAAGDKVLAESYYQHADHFARVMPDTKVVDDNSLNANVKDDTQQLKTQVILKIKLITY